MAGSVVVTVGAAHEALMPALCEATAKLRVGDGIDEETDVGPVISAAARDRIVEAIDRAEREGARSPSTAAASPPAKAAGPSSGRRSSTG